MTVEVFKNIEEALFREVRRITHHQDRTKSNTNIQETFDPFTGEIVKTNVEPSFYDSSADTGFIQYPHVFIKLLSTVEDRFSNREVSYYGNSLVCAAEDTDTPITNDRAYEYVIPMQVGQIPTDGNDITLSTFKIRKVLPGHLIRILDGNNKGTYKVGSVAVGGSGIHTITLSNTLVDNLPTSNFNSTSRTLTFLDSVEIGTVKVGDEFVDNSSNLFTILSINDLTIELDGVIIPDITSGGLIQRSGDVLVADVGNICLLVLDGSKPILGASGNVKADGGNKNINPQIPIDAHYLIRIDSKEKKVHTEILTRMWEEFNPPRTALSTIVRSKDSAEQLLTSDITTGGSSTVVIGDNSKFNINENVFIIDNFNPTKDELGGFAEPFKAKIVGLVGTDSIVLDKIVPDTFTVDTNSLVVSNADHLLYMFHFVDHLTKDVESAQYWVHEFVFWVQLWVDRLGKPQEFDSTIHKVSTPLEDINGVLISNDIP